MKYSTNREGEDLGKEEMKRKTAAEKGRKAEGRERKQNAWCSHESALGQGLSPSPAHRCLGLECMREVVALPVCHYTVNNVR